MQEKYTLQIDLNNNGTDWDINIRQPENQTLYHEDFCHKNNRAVIYLCSEKSQLRKQDYKAAQ